MENVKFHGIPLRKREIRGSIPPRKPKSRGSARRSAETVGPSNKLTKIVGLRSFFF